MIRTAPWCVFPFMIAQSAALSPRPAVDGWSRAVLSKGASEARLSSDVSPGQEPLTCDADALVRRIALSRDRDAFKALFVSYAPRVKTYLMRHGAAPEKAEELAQETLLTIWRKADYFDPSKASAAGWIFTIARNLRIDTLRRERSALVYQLVSPEAPEPSSTPETDSEDAERDSRVRAAVAQLPAEQLEVVRLSFFADKAHAEIASDLSLPLGTVKSRLRLALVRLRNAMGDFA